MRKKSLGVTVFGVLLIVTSLSQMGMLTEFSRYKIIFQHIPENILLARYALSWSLRIVGLACGFGLLNLKDAFRKIGLGLNIFTILTIFGKHPFTGYKNHIEYMAQQGFIHINSILFALKIPYEALIWVCVIVTSAVDLIFAISFIYFFTRPSVKKQFQPNCK